jgi:hypothetical protein
MLEKFFGNAAETTADPRSSSLVSEGLWRPKASKQRLDVRGRELLAAVSGSRRVFRCGAQNGAGWGITEVSRTSAGILGLMCANIAFL